MNVLAVILARAGSVGLQNKHLLPLCGRPVIAYTFDHAFAARSITRTVVTSDCDKIRRLAALAGIATIARPAHLATADASVQDVMLHAMDAVEGVSTFRADALVVFYGNVPVRGASVIDRAVDVLAETGCDSVRSFCPVGKWHPAWMSQLSEERVIPLQAGSIHRRQDLPPLFLHDGAVVAVSRASMLRGRATPQDPHAFFGTDRRGIETPAGETVEIDQLRDLYWAEAVLRDSVRRDGTDYNLRMAI
jgi:N-acylneuraminate cytidylyltransferase